MHHLLDSNDQPAVKAFLENLHKAVLDANLPVSLGRIYHHTIGRPHGAVEIVVRARQPGTARHARVVLQTTGEIGVYLHNHQAETTETQLVFMDSNRRFKGLDIAAHILKEQFGTTAQPVDDVCPVHAQWAILHARLACG